MFWDELGRDGTGFEHANAHVLLRDFLAERFGEAVHSKLGHVGDPEVRPGLTAGDRGDVHDVGDAPQFVLGRDQQMRERCVCDVEQTGLVDRDHPLPLPDVGAHHGPEEHQAGVVDEDVEPIEAVDRQKQMRVSKGGLAWLRLLDNPDIVFRFDVVEILLPEEGEPLFELIQNAFELSQPYIY